MLGHTELFVIVGLIVLFFGASQIPKFARNVGKAKREFERGMREGAVEADEEEKDDGESKRKEG